MPSKKKLRANWPEFVGLPTPDAGPWMMRDTPITRRGLSLLKPKNRSLPGAIEYVDGKPKHVMGTETKAETAQIRYETSGRSVEDSVLGALADLSPVPGEVWEAFAADPDADLYVVELFPSPAVANDIERVRDVLGLDVQLVGVGESEPDGYPGAFVEAGEEELTNPSSGILRAIPAADLLVMTPRIARSNVTHKVIEGSGARAVAVNPVEGDVKQIVEEDLLLREDDGVGDDQLTLDAWGSGTGDEAQLSLWQISAD